MINRLLERIMPWYNPELDEAKQVATAITIKRSERARKNAESVIREYGKAEKVVVALVSQGK